MTEKKDHGQDAHATKSKQEGEMQKLRYGVDLRSDTLTLPTEEMRRAMAEAEVGDDVMGEDPTVIRLEELGAELMGKESGLFVPSGTMGNLISILTHTRRGDEVIMERGCHSTRYECGGTNVIAGCATCLLDGDGGILDPAQVIEAIKPLNVHFPRTALLCLENTHNVAGGTVMTVERTAALGVAAHEAGLKVHLDGARIFNAAVALGVDASALAAPVDSATFCVSKGLSAPVGSVLCGSKDFIDEALRNRKLLGGGMRQAGVLAAAGLVAVTKMVSRLAEDHANARLLAEGLSGIPGLTLKRNPPPTNMVYVMLDEDGIDGKTFVERLAGMDVGAMALGKYMVRMVLHRHIDGNGVRKAVVACERIMSQKQ